MNRFFVWVAIVAVFLGALSVGTSGGCVTGLALAFGKTASGRGGAGADGDGLFVGCLIGGAVLGLIIGILGGRFVWKRSR
jgi:hypothetical protein